MNEIEYSQEARCARMMGSGFFKRAWPDEVGAILKTGFEFFEMANGVMGLARVTDMGMEVLSVLSPEKNKGHFRAFIAAAKEKFNRVRVLEDWNPIIGQALARYGFRRFTDPEGFRGWEWRKELL